MNRDSRVLEWAKFYRAQGLSVIPIKYESKEPLIPWKEFQERQPTEDELQQWFRTAWINIGIVCGRVSDNLVVIDFDDPVLFEDFIVNLPSDIKEKLRRTWIVKTGKGYHIYIKLKNPEYTKSRRFEGVDIKGEGGYVVAPPSKHPSGSLYEFVRDPHECEIVVLEDNEFEQILDIIKKIQKKDEQSEFRELTDSEILKIAELLKPAYRKGNRELLVGLYLSAWCYKKRISKNSIIKIAKILADHDTNEDREQKLQRILKQIEYHYSGRYEDYLQRTGKELKSKSGIQEILENTLGEQKALEILEQLQRILGASPYNDSIFGIIDLSRGLYFISDPRRGWIVRAKKTEDGGFQYKEIVAECAPIAVTIYDNPLTSERLYEIEFTGLVKKKIGPANLEDIVNWLRAVGVVKHRRLIEDALSAIVSAFQRTGKAEIREEIDKPGFYYIQGELRAIKWTLENYNTEQLREALELLEELRNQWYKHLGERFTTIIKWGLLAPFSYAIKQVKGTFDIHYPWILVYGSTGTGKSTLGKIIRMIWNLPPVEESGGKVDTKARLARVVSESTFLSVVGEVFDLLNEKSVKELVKTAVQHTVVRGKYDGGKYREEPALSALYLSTNYSPPMDDDALIRRLLLIYFGPKDKISEQRKQEFLKNVVPRLEKSLKYIGFAVARRILENPSLLEKDWVTLATELLEDLWREVGQKPPEWVKEFYKGETIEDTIEYIDEEIRSVLLDEVNQLSSKYIDEKIPDIKGRVESLLLRGFIPWAVYKEHDRILITTAILRVLKKKDIPVESLKALAERFGWLYKKMKVNGTVKMVIVLKIDEFAKFLEGKFDDEEQDKNDKDDKDDQPPAEEDVKPSKESQPVKDSTTSNEDKRRVEQSSTSNNEEGSATKDDTNDKVLDEIDRKILECYKLIVSSVPELYQPKAFVQMVVKKLGYSDEIKERIFRLIEIGKVPEFYKEALERFFTLRDDNGTDRDREQYVRDLKHENDEVLSFDYEISLDQIRVGDNQ